MLSSDSLPDRTTPVSQQTYEDTYVLLYGISVVQTYMYYLKYPRDSSLLKLIVFALSVLGTFHTILMYHYLVRSLLKPYVLSYTRPQLLIDGEWSVYASTLVGVVMCFIVQIFFARMIYHLTKGIWKIVIASTCVVFSVAQLAFGIFFTTREIQVWELAGLQTIVLTTMVPMLAFRIVADILISSSLCYTLYDTRAGELKSRKLINTLMIYAMNRFVLTTVVVVIQMAVLIAKPQSIGAMVIEFVTVHLYVNSFLATLNARSHLRSIAESYAFSDIEIHVTTNGNKSNQAVYPDVCDGTRPAQSVSQHVESGRSTVDFPSESHSHLQSRPALVSPGFDRCSSSRDDHEFTSQTCSIMSGTHDEISKK
ncbi:hypothetical protein K435DRAFT_840242 [Dendrothele bispora CBS 962.96]|uniref:DUF6534 domain-containing protein n=1 Tax=Dendrothele bispora (strain CBS 962.96) TaxID=1314807 RepID=A0A4S8LUZ6_DENBC|nr:hypothetical protein K435DRAFT_840242 [Dendrothele bispora CBS 962.96]